MWRPLEPLSSYMRMLHILGQPSWRQGLYICKPCGRYEFKISKTGPREVHVSWVMISHWWDTWKWQPLLAKFKSSGHAERPPGFEAAPRLQGGDQGQVLNLQVLAFLIWKLQIIGAPILQGCNCDLIPKSYTKHLKLGAKAQEMLAAATQQALNYLQDTTSNNPKEQCCLFSHSHFLLFCFSLFVGPGLLSCPRLGGPWCWFLKLSLADGWEDCKLLPSGAPHILTAPFWAGCTGGHNTSEVTGRKDRLHWDTAQLAAPHPQQQNPPWTSGQQSAGHSITHQTWVQRTNRDKRRTRGQGTSSTVTELSAFQWGSQGINIERQ